MNSQNSNNIDQLQSQQINFDINKAFAQRELIEKLNSTDELENNKQIQLENNKQIQLEDLEKMISSLPLINSNIRSNIQFSLEIYKKLNNFERNYIHSILNEKSKNSK